MTKRPGDGARPIHSVWSLPSIGLVWGDYIVNTERSPVADPVAPKLQTVLVLETKGLYFDNEDTAYKRELFELCNRMSEPWPMEAIAQQFSDHKVQFEVVYDDEYRQVLNAMFSA